MRDVQPAAKLLSPNETPGLADASAFGALMQVLSPTPSGPTANPVAGQSMSGLLLPDNAAGDAENRIRSSYVALNPDKSTKSGERMAVYFSNTPRIKKNVAYGVTSLQQNGLSIVYDGYVPRNLGLAAIKLAMMEANVKGAIVYNENNTSSMPSFSRGRDLVTVYTQVGIEFDQDIDSKERFRAALAEPGFTQRIAKKIFDQGQGRGADPTETLNAIQNIINTIFGGILGLPSSQERREPAF